MLHRLKMDVYKKISIGAAEFLGTSVLVFVACMGCNKAIAGGEIAPLQSAFTSGLAVLIVIHVSIRVYFKIVVISYIFESDKLGFDSILDDKSFFCSSFLICQSIVLRIHIFWTIMKILVT